VYERVRWGGNCRSGPAVGAGRHRPAFADAVQGEPEATDVTVELLEAISMANG
jgi:hypothetical protein